MARIRSIKPEFWIDQDLAVEVPNRDARMLYVGLWNQSDEHGRLRADATWIKGQVFPYDDDLTPEAIDKLIDLLVEAGRAVRYQVRSSGYLYLPKLAGHQRLEPHKTPSRLPEPPIDLPQQQSGKFPEKAAQNAGKSAPKQAASSRLHAAGPQSPEIPAPTAALPAGTDQAASLIIAATACTPELAIEAAVTIARERRPRNLPGLIQRIIDAGELGDWLRKAEAALGRQASARASPCLPHGKRNCSICQSEAKGRADA